MAKKKKRYGYKDGDENARFAPGGSAASEWEEQQRQSFTMGRTINPSDTSKRFNTEQDVENYKPIKTETYQSYMASKLAQAKANNPKSRVHITANDLSSYSNARAKLYDIDPTANLMRQGEFTSQYKSSVDKKARLNDMVQLAQGLDLGNTQDLVRKSYNDLGAVEGLANTRTNAEGLLKRVEEYRKLYGDSKELKVLEDRAKGIADYINTNAKGGSAVSQAVFDEANAPVVKSMYDKDTQTRDEIKAKNKAISDANIEEKYGKAGDLGYEGVKNIKAETPAEADWKEEKQLQLDPFKKYEDNKKEIESLENDGNMPLGNQNGKGYEDEQEAKNDRINALREQNTQILSQYAEDIIAKANLTDDERRKLETGRSFDLSDNEFRWDVGDKAKNEVTLNRKEMIDVLTKRGISKEEASLLLDYENELDKENERQAAINAGELRRRTDSEIGNLTEDIARTIGQPIISPLERVMGVSGEYAHAEQLGRQQAREKYYEDDTIGQALYDFGETAGTIVGSSLLGGAAAVPFTTKAVEDSYYNALDKGASESDAMNYAATNGIMTGIIYGIGLKGVNKLLSKSVKGSVVEGLAKEIVEGKPTSSLGKAIIKSVGTNAVKEGGIFAGLTTTTQVADTLNQVINLGNKSDFNQMVEAYKQQGMSEDEAWQNTVLDISKQIGQGAVESFASGAIMGAGGALIGNARQALRSGDRLPENTLLRSEEGTPLRDSQGKIILDDNGQPIRVQQGLNIDRDGNVLNRNISEEVRVTQSENGVPIIDSSGNQVTVNGQPIRAERTTLSGVETYNKLRNEYENARVGLDNIQERIEGLWDDYKQQGFSNPEEVADFEKVRAKFNKDYVHVVNKAKAILGEYTPISARDQQDLLEGRKKLEDFREDLETVNPSSEEVKAEVDELKAEVDTQIDNIDTVVETQEVATADIVVPEENAIGKSKSGKPIYIDEVNGTDVTFVDSEGKKVTDYELDDTPQTELMELAIDKDYNTDTTKSMIKGFELANTDNVEAYADNYDVFYAAGKDSSIKNFKDALAKAPELTSALEIVGTDAAGKAFSEGRKQVSPLQQKGLTKLPKGKFTNDTGKTNAATEYAEMFAIFSGGDVVATENPEKFISSKVEPGSIRGVYIEPEGKIIIDTKYTSFIRALNHEFGHLTDNFAIDEAEAVSDACMKFARESLGIKGVDDAIKNLQETYEANGQEISYTEAQNEFIKNIIGTAMASPEGIEGLVGEFAKDEKISAAKKQSIISKFIEWIKNLIEKLKVYAKEGGTYEDTEFVLGNKEQRQDIINKQIDALKASRKILEEMSAELEGTTDTSEKFSLTEEQKELSKEYNNAVKNNDMDKAAELVKEYAASKGYDTKVYHGTTEWGFTKIDLGKSDDNISFFATDDINTAHTYSAKNEIKRLSDTRTNKPVYKMNNQELAEIQSDIIGKEIGIITKNNMKARDEILDNAIKAFIDYCNEWKKTVASYGGTSIYNKINKLYDEWKQDKTKITKIEAYFKNRVKNIWDNGFDSKAQDIFNAVNNFYGDNKNKTLFYVKDNLDYPVQTKEALKDEIKVFRNKYSGNYELYANTDNFLTVDADSEKWNDIEYNAPITNKKTYGELYMKRHLGVNKVDYNPKDDTYVYYVGADNEKKVEDAKTFEKTARGINFFNTRELAIIARNEGYAGVKIENVIDDGGTGDNWYLDPATVYIFFNPVEQVKSADPITYDDNGNVIPLAERFSKDHDDIRYSVDENKGELVEDIPDVLDESGADEDDKGRKLSKDQVEYFKNSKVRLDGDLETTYHGTVSDFTVFDRQFANIEGDWGKGYYFTNDINDVKRNYATEDGADLTNKIEQRADILESVEGYEDLSYDERYDVARKEFIKGDARYIEAYLNITNPVYVDEAHPTLLFEYEDLEGYRQDSREDYDTDEEYNEALYYEVESNLIEPILDEITNEYQLDTRDINELSSILYEAVYEGGITAQNLKDKINQVHIYKFDAEDEGIAGNEIARQVIESLGYDGIIDTTVSSKFRNMGLHPDVTHYITFNSNQAKNIDNKQPTTNEDIRYSIDNQDEELEIDTREKALVDANKELVNALSELKENKLDESEIRTIASSYKKNFNVDLTTKTVAEELKKVVDAVVKSKANINAPEVNRVAEDFIKNILRNSKGEIQEDNARILRDIKKTPIRLSEGQKKEIDSAFGSYNSWRKSNMGNLTIRNEGIPLDSQWVEWSDMYPAIFDSSISDANEPLELDRIISSLKDGIPFDNRPEAIQSYKAELLKSIADGFKLGGKRLQNKFARLERLITKDYNQRIRDALKEQRTTDTMYFNRKLSEMRSREKLRKKEQDIRKETTKVRQNNIKAIGKLKRMYLYPTNKSRIPTVLQSTVGTFLESIDPSIFGNKLAKYQKQIDKLTQQLSKTTGDLYTQTANQLQDLIAKKNANETAFIKLAEDYENKREELQNIDEFSEALAQSLKELAGKMGFSNTALDDMNFAMQKFGGRSIQDFDLGEQKLLNKVLKMLTTEIENYNRIIDASIIAENGQALHISEVVEQGVNEIESVGARQKDFAFTTDKDPLSFMKKIYGKALNTKLSFTTKNLRPDVLLSKTFGFHKNNTGDQIFNMLLKGYLEYKDVEMKASKMLEKPFKDKKDKEYIKTLQKYDKENLYDIGVINDKGQPVKVPKAFAIQLKRLLDNPLGKEHIMGDGLIIPNVEQYYKNRKGLDSLQQVVNGIDTEVIAYNKNIAKELSKDDPDFDKIKKWDNKIDLLTSETKKQIAKIEAQLDSILTEWDKEYIKNSYDIFDGFLKNKLNEKTQLRFGYDGAQVEKYTRFVTDPDSLASYKESGYGVEQNMEAVGFMQRRTGARNALILEDALIADKDQIGRSAEYIGFMIPQHNLNRILKYTAEKRDAKGELVYGADNKPVKMNITKAMRRNYPEALDYIEDLKLDLFGGKPQAQHGFIANLGMAVTAQQGLVGNVGVEAMQTSSHLFAASEISFGSLLKALVRGGKNKHPLSRADRELIDKYSPLLWDRDPDNMQEVQAAMNDNILVGRLYRKMANNKALSYVVARIPKFDNATVGRSWYASEFDIKKDYPNLKVGSEEYYKKVAELFNSTVIKAHPMYSALFRNEYQRSNNAVIKMLEMFKTVLAQQMNTVYLEVGRHNAYRQDYKNNKAYNTTEKDVKKQGKKMRRTIAAFFIATSYVWAIASGVSALLYHKKPSEWTNKDGDVELGRVLKSYIDKLVGTYAGAFLLGSDLMNAVNKATDNAVGYGDKYHYDFSLNVVDVTKRLFNIIGNMGDLNSDNPHKKEQYIENATQSLMGIFGLPYRNTKKFVTGVAGIVEDFADNGEFDYSNELEGSQELRKWAKGELGKEQVKDEMTTLKVGNAVKTVYLDGDITKEQAIEKLEESGLYKGTSNRSLSSVLEGKVEKWDIDSYKDEYLSTLTSGGAETAESRAVIQKITNLPYSNAFYSDSSKSHYKNYASPHDKLIEHIKSWNPVYKKKKKSEQ